MLSLLLGAHPPQRHVRHLLGSAELFGVSESALRVALTRMTSAGELERFDGVYRLNARLLERQRRQDESINARTVPWSEDWEQAIVVVSGRATIAFADGRVVEAGPGDALALRAGDRTTWTVHERLRKVYLVVE